MSALAVISSSFKTGLPFDSCESAQLEGKLLHLLIKKVAWLHCSALRLELALWTEDFLALLDSRAKLRKIEQDY